jgi:hypothetical protein
MRYPTAVTAVWRKPPWLLGMTAVRRSTAVTAAASWVTECGVQCPPRRGGGTPHCTAVNAQKPPATGGQSEVAL